MAEITRQRVGELLQAVFQILKENPEGLPAREVLEGVEKRLELTPFEQSTYPNNPEVRRFEKIVRFSTISPVKAGWMVKDKGQWSITEAGLEALANFTEPEELAQKAAHLYRQWKRGQDELAAEEEESETASAMATLEEAEESSWSEIQAYLQNLSPYDFQELVAGLLEGMGYHVVWISPPGPDKGMDIIAHTDPLGVEGPRIKVQVKRRADRISSDEVRSFIAVLGDTDVGLFVAAGGFSRESENEIRTQERRLFPLRPVYYLDLSS